MTRILIAALGVSLLALTVSGTSASARMCARYCQGGVCWTDCSKIPGQTRATGLQRLTTTKSVAAPKPALGGFSVRRK